MTFEKMEKLMEKYRFVKKNMVIRKHWKTHDIKLIKLKFYFINNGIIYFEDTDAQVYVGGIRCGFLKRKTAVAAVHLDRNTEELMLSVYAQEGILDRHVAEVIVNEFHEEFSGFIHE